MDVMTDTTHTTSARDDVRPGIPPLRTVAGKREGIALCLSGGGFLGASHLGAAVECMRSGCSNGSAHLAPFRADRFSPGSSPGGSSRVRRRGSTVRRLGEGRCRAFPTCRGRDMAALPILLHLPWNWLFPGPRMRQLERRYQELAGDVADAGGASGPAAVCLCATDVVFGVNWEVSSRS